MTGVHDVAIVGFGPVGQTLALLLGRQGHDVVVLERQPQPYPRPRAVVFDSEVGRLFQSAGVEDALKAISEAVPDHYEWRNAAGETLVSIDWSGTGPGGWPIESFFSQPDLETVLADAVAALDTVTVHRGAEARALHVGPDNVEIVWSGPTVKARTVRARYVIGADGANSFVREHMATAVEDLGFFFDWLICDLVPHDADREWAPMNWQLCDPARPTTIVSGGPGRRRFEFMRLPDESVDDLNREERAWELLAPWGCTPANTTLERHTVYTFQARWAHRWNDGRLLLAGDAAHLMPPFAGQGMCSGIRDAANLAWKLDLVLQGATDPTVLDTYTDERRTHLQHAIQLSVELGKVICVLDPESAAARDARMIAGGADPRTVLPPPPPGGGGLTDGVLHRGPDGRTTPGAGALAEQHPVRHEGREQLLDHWVRTPGFVLLTDGIPRSALPADAIAIVDRWRVTVLPLADAGGPALYTDVTGAYLGPLRTSGDTAVLVRPDFYVFGRATADGIGALLTDLDRQLSGATVAPEPEVVA